MSCFDNDPLYMRLTTMLDSCCNRVEDILTQQQKLVVESKLQDELAARFQQELKINSELSERVSQVSSRVCRGARSQSQPQVAPSDCLRLHKAREAYQVGKELSGVRWDFAAPPSLVKGYIRSEARKALHPFEYELDEREGECGGCAGCGGCGGCAVSQRLWGELAEVAGGRGGGGSGGSGGKENRDPAVHNH